MNKMTLTISLLLPAFCMAANTNYPANRAPLNDAAFIVLPVGTVTPEGWLKDQLTIQANGLTGHVDEFWESLSKSAWKGGDGDSWERGPYYLDGLVPLAYILKDERLMAKVKQWIEPTLATAKPDGWFGPEKNKDRWPLAVALKVLTQYYEATGDARALDVIKNYFNWLRKEKPDWPDTEWRGARAMENVVTAFWLYRRTGDPTVMEVADSIFKNSFDWPDYFINFPYTCKVLGKGLKYGQTFKTPEGEDKLFGHPTHVVNIAMAVKHPAVWYQRSNDDVHKKATYAAIANLDKYHGQVGGRFSGDEHLGGLKPTQGTELCAIVEYMFSLEHMIAALGDVEMADRLEMLAYNGNPGTCLPNYWAHQYDQQANQVLVNSAPRDWTTNKDDSNLYGLEPNFGCCTANMHQGWPKFISHMWMATNDNGLAAVAYGPNRVKAKVAGGETVTILQQTDYPFDGVVRFTIECEKPVKFPLYLRIPAWADNAELKVGEEAVKTAPKSFAAIDRTWKSGDQATLTLPMNIRTETRYNKSVSIIRGPLYYSLKIGQQFNKLKSHSDKYPADDWEIIPTTPWNYGLLVDRSSPEKSITTQVKKPGKVPFEQKDAPVVLKIKGKTIPEWKLINNSAGDPPTSPVKSDSAVAELELIPYGCTQLRITEFPTIAE